MSARRRGAPPASRAGELELFGPGDPPARPTAPRRTARAERSVPPPPPRASFAEAVIPGASPESAVSVMALTATAREVLEGAFMPLWVRGEVSDFKAHRSGHWYFTLRDADAQLRCVVWSRDRRRIPAPPDDGMQVAALGQLTVYPARGEMRFFVTRMEAEGDGLWRKALNETQRRLHVDGLLDPARKRRIPRYPRRIAVVTSRDGAALRDIAAVVQRRCPSVEIVLVPAVVQGDTAPDSLCIALDRVARWASADVLIIGRGGGSREDLWAFNDERVARALAACPVPTISAVGHEIDMSICDLVADLRAPTPSAAAEAAVPVGTELRARVRALGAVMASCAGDHLRRARAHLEDSAEQLAAAGTRTVERRRAALERAASRLHALSPLGTLERGYAIVRREGLTLRSARTLRVGDAIEVVLRDGEAAAVIEHVAERTIDGRSATGARAGEGGAA